MSQATRTGIFFIGLALLAGLNVLVTCRGYRAGFSAPVDIGSPIGGLGILLLPLLVFLLARIAWLWGKRPVTGRVVVLIILLALQLLCLYSGGYSFGSAQSMSMGGRERNNLRIIAQGVEDYARQHSALPLSLDALAPGQLRERPTSVYGERPIHYALLDGLTTGTTPCWIIWSPGPDQQYELQDGPALQAALARLANNEASPWLVERMYDPSNGSASRGDFVCFRDSGRSSDHR